MKVFEVLYVNPVVAFLFGLAGGALLWAIFGTWTREKIILLTRRYGSGGWLASTLESWVAKVFYDQKANAFVAPNISKSRDFLDITFPSYENAEGEIWLYQSDMLAFSNHKDFENLYINKVLPDDNIKSVKVVVSDRADPNSDAGIARSKKIHRWHEIKENLNRAQEDKLNVKKLRVCTSSKIKRMKRLDSRFLNFVDDETWIFYVRFDKSGGVNLIPPANQMKWLPNVCIHRRFVDPTTQEQQMDDERVVVTGTYPDRQPSLENLMPLYIRGQFSHIFRSQEPWIPIDEYLNSRIFDQ